MAGFAAGGLATVLVVGEPSSARQVPSRASLCDSRTKAPLVTTVVGSLAQGSAAGSVIRALETPRPVFVSVSVCERRETGTRRAGGGRGRDGVSAPAISAPAHRLRGRQYNSITVIFQSVGSLASTT